MISTEPDTNPEPRIRETFQAIAAALVACAALFEVANVEAGTVVKDQTVGTDSLAEPIPYWLYLPDGWKNGDQVPVVYLLHGYNAGPGAWFHAAGLEDTADRMIEAGLLAPTVFVIPKLGNSWYVDSAAFGPVETAFLDDAIPQIEGALGLDLSREDRGVAGISMGGFGALRLAYHRPDVFAATAALSPAILEDVDHSWRLSPSQIKLFGEAFGDPFDPLRFRNVNVFSPLDRLSLMDDPPQTYITIGDDDYFELWRGSSLLFLDLRARNLPVEMRITDGGHVWPLWKKELPNVLSFFQTVFMKAE